MIRCSVCSATRRDVTLWRQIVDLAKDVVCCWPNA